MLLSAIKPQGKKLGQIAILSDIEKLNHERVKARLCQM